MNSPLNALLGLKQVSSARFESVEHRENFRKTLFGGQVLAQALMAACHDNERAPHSLHAYFLRAGSSAEPVIYEVESVRDGRSISNRRVVAFQAERPIFHLSCSFHVEEQGFEHQEAFPDIPAPEQALQSWSAQNDGHVAPHDQDNQAANPFDIVPVGENLFFSREKKPAEGYFWIKTREALADDISLQCGALAFASDLGVLASALLPHEATLFDQNIFAASIDHAMWFHSRDFRADDWLLCKVMSPWAGSARGFGVGRIFTREGKLIASTAQEGLIRRI